MHGKAQELGILTDWLIWDWDLSMINEYLNGSDNDWHIYVCW